VAAARRVAEGKVLAAYERHLPNGDGPAPVDVLGELGRLVAEVTRFKDFAATRIEALSGEQWAAHDPATAAEVAMFERACDRAGRLLVDIARFGLDLRRGALDEQLAEDMEWVIRAALADVEIGVPPGLSDALARRQRQRGGYA
jgi:hypothetical protein